MNPFRVRNLLQCPRSNLILMMRRLANILALVLGCFALTVALYLPGLAQTRTSDLVRLDLDRTQIPLSCKFATSRKLCPETARVKVSVVTKKPRPRLSYTVTGGRIIGSGSNVQWDISAVRSGSYTITVRSSNGSTLTGLIAISECPDCGGDCDCPELSMADPVADPDHLGVYSISAVVKGGEQDSVGYVWTVIGGEIISGQKTSAIWFRVSPFERREELRVSYRLDDLDPDCACPTGFSKTFVVSTGNTLKPIPDGLLLDKNTITLSPPPGFASASGDCELGLNIKVRTIISGLVIDGGSFDYNVSGGKIIGTGDSVRWDLSDVKPGSYTISASRKDRFSNSPQTFTETVNVLECPIVFAIMVVRRSLSWDQATAY